MNIGVSEQARSRALPSQLKSVEQLLQEGNKNLRQIKETLCCANGLSNAIVLYQPIDCNGDPVGTPLYVLPTISVAKQDVNICNTNAIVGTYNVLTTRIIDVSTTAVLADLSLDVTKLHSLSYTVLTGTVGISGDLGGGFQATTALPVGVSSTWTASTVFGTGDVAFTTDGTGTVLITAMSSL